MRTSAPEALEVQVDERARLRVLRLRGEIDLGTAAEIAVALRDIDGRTGLAVEMCGVTFIDSTGLRALLRARYRFGRRLWLVAPSPCVRRLLGLTGMDGEFQIVEARERIPGHRDR
jgi:anti-anti-sigma factor